MCNMVNKKVEELIEKFSFDKENEYFIEALCVAKYISKPQANMPNNMQVNEVDNPNRTLALIGDGVLKLVLAQESSKIFDNVETINNFINSNESNDYLHSLNIIQPSNGYCIEDDKIIQNKKSDIISIVTMLEAIIGALYLDEYQKYGTFNVAYGFIKEYIIANKIK